MICEISRNLRDLWMRNSGPTARHRSPRARARNTLDRMCHMSHTSHMITISIRKLHEATGRYVREARTGPVVITDRGVRVAVLRPLIEGEFPGKPFPRRDPRKLPRVTVDSTTLISADRNTR